jgi:hypothetical protein
MRFVSGVYEHRMAVFGAWWNLMFMMSIVFFDNTVCELCGRWGTSIETVLVNQVIPKVLLRITQSMSWRGGGLYDLTWVIRRS